MVISLEGRLLQKIEEAIADAERRRRRSARPQAQGDSKTIEEFLVRMREQRRRIRRDFYLGQQSSTDSLSVARQRGRVQLADSYPVRIMSDEHGKRLGAYLASMDT